MVESSKDISYKPFILIFFTLIYICKAQATKVLKKGEILFKI